MDLRERVQRILDEIRFSLQADGGDVELVDVDENGIVKVRLQGTCVGCPYATLTIKAGIERILKQQLPEIKEVKDVTST